MKLTKYKLGTLIEQCDERNSDLKYSVDEVRGISTGKEFILTKANMNGVSLTSYKIIKSNEFAYVADTSRRGEKIAIAFNDCNKSYLISSIYTVFKVKKTELLLSDYLFMYFNRSEFDRFSRFNSWGSAREIFDWSEMCDIDIELPSIDIQKKYVDIYNAMIQNQQSYESGLEDLKISFDALIDRYKHTVKRILVKNILSEVDNRNSDGAITTLKGINISKQFMDSVANTTNVDLSKYKIVKNSQIVFSGMQTGRDKCIRIALSSYDYPIIISPAYTVFDITNSDIIPEYFMMWFSRDESDRYGWFISDSSIRSNLDLDRFYETEVPVPDKRIQKSIVEIYKAYIDRRRINEILKQQIKGICPILIKGAIEEARRES